MLKILPIACLAALAADAAAQTGWVWRNPIPHGFEYRRVAAVNGRLAAFGGGNAGFVTSEDGGKSWRRISEPHTGFQDVAFGKSKYVAAGLFGLIATSPDGVKWAETTWPQSDAPSYYGIAFGGAPGRFVLVGSDQTTGVIRSSEDGITWALRDSGSYRRIASVAYGNGVFVTSSYDGETLTSADGLQWIREQSGANTPMGRLTFTGTRFLAPSRKKIVASTDGKSWESLPLGPDTVSLPAAVSVAEGNGRLVAVVSGSTIWSGPSGGTLKAAFNDPAQDFNSVAFADGAFLAVGMYGTIARSTDGEHWEYPSGFTWHFSGLAYGNGAFLACMRSETLLSSADGIAWARREVPGLDRSIRALSHSGGFLALGDSLAILSSADGATWNRTSSNLPTLTENGFNFLNRVIRGGNAVVAVGNWGALTSSIDGAAFTPRATGTLAVLRGLVYGQNTWVAVGDSGTVLTSEDGVAWTSRTSGIKYDLNDVGYGAGLFVAVGDRGLITSPDGRTWTSRTASISMPIMAIGYGGGVFTASAYDRFDQELLSSTDGITWKVQYKFEMRSGLSQFAFGAGRMVAVGSHGSVLTADPLSLGASRPELIRPAPRSGIRLVPGAEGPRVAVPASLGSGPVRLRLIHASGKEAGRRTAAPLEGMLALPRATTGQGVYILFLESEKGQASGAVVLGAP